MVKKQDYEYIKLENVDRIQADVDTAKSNFEHAVDRIKDDKQLKKEERSDITEANHLITYLSHCIKRLNVCLLKSVFEPKGAPVKKVKRRIKAKKRRR